MEFLNIDELYADYLRVFAYVADKVRGKLPTLARFIR